MAAPISGVTPFQGTDPVKTAAPAAANNGDVSKDMFIKLLVAQIQNQNPLNPADGIQYLSQLAQFSQLEQLMQINSSLGSVGKTGTGAAPAPVAGKPAVPVVQSPAPGI